MAVLCGFAAVLAVACDKVPLLAPQESTITLSSASTVVQANGTTEIRATVIEPSGTPVQNGTTVTVHDESRNTVAGRSADAEWRRNGAVPRQWPVRKGNDQGALRWFGIRGARALRWRRCLRPGERYREPCIGARRRRNDDDLRGCCRRIGESPFRSACEFYARLPARSAPPL